MTNREKLNSECMYDLLCRMNDKLESEGGGCVMLAFIEYEEARKRCPQHRNDCSKCIAAFLNERAAD
jgi:hypothetical protein